MIKEKLLGVLWRNRHWTTKIVWTLGLTMAVTGLILILMFPPGISGKGYTFVYGQVIKQGVLFTTIYNSVDANITVNSINECPTSPDGSKGFGNGRCFISIPVNVTIPDSFSFRVYDSSDSSLVGKEIAVKGGLREGEWTKLALKGDTVQDKGDWLWSGQRRVLGFYFMGYLDFSSSPDYKSEYAASGLIIIIILMLSWFFVGFLVVQDSIILRLLSGLLVTEQISAMIPAMITEWLPFEGINSAILGWIWMPIYLSSVILVPILFILNIILLFKKPKK